jgi:PHD/YefM family antitoxin component YafN of YafNO toxin-antitoxin module
LHAFANKMAKAFKSHEAANKLVNLLTYLLLEHIMMIQRSVSKMDAIRGAIENTVSISLFNKGLAGRIFEDVKRYGAKVVMKNNSAECVLMSPEEYVRLMDEVNDARLLAEASARMTHFDPAKLLSDHQIDEALGLSPEDYADTSEVEFE